jgi:hypothetical protein
MRTRLLGLSLAGLFLAPVAARADDTKPPVISDVKAQAKGGKVSVEAKVTDETGVLSAVCKHRKMGSSKFEESPMTKNDYDDTFKVTFSGEKETEYYIESTDLLGNGPATYGTNSKPMNLGGKQPVAVAMKEEAPPQIKHEEPPPREPAPVREPKEPREPRPTHAKHEKEPASTGPVVMHHKPTSVLPEGQDVTLHVRITSSVGLKQEALFARPKGYVRPDPSQPEYTLRYAVNQKSGDAYEVTIPGSDAHGTLEYFIVAQDNNGVKTNLGDPDVTHWFSITFKAGDAKTQPLLISSLSPAKATPGSPLHVRAQATLPSQSAEMSDGDATDAATKAEGVSAKVLFRTQDAGDQEMEMSSDPTGGEGGFMADLPAQPDGNPIYYQVVMCLADKCAIDTGSKRKWNSLTATAGDPVAPAPLNGVSSKAPAGLPE